MALLLPDGCDLITLETVGSTNDYAKAHARENPQTDRLVVRAVTQTAGRGRHGNAWSSLSGNLFMSLLLRTDMPAADMGQLSFLAAVALHRTLADYGVDAGLKWPNDVLVQGRKIAGILLETEAQGADPAGWVVMGIGVNVAIAPEGAVSLALAGGGENVTAEDVMAKLVAHIFNLYDTLAAHGFDAVRRAWLDAAVGLGGPVTVRTARESYAGIFHGVDMDGALLLDMPDGARRRVSSGEVFLNA